MVKRTSLLAAALNFCGTIGLIHPAAAQSTNVSLSSKHWQVLAKDIMGTKGEADFRSKEGFPEGLLVLKAGTAELRDFVFRSGTIEYDFKPLGQDMPGIQFRIQGNGTAEDGEEVYERISGDERASNDGLQYTPIIHGFLLWNAYPQFQRYAPLLDGWNHVRLDIHGVHMAVYINRSPEPTLRVDNLRSRSLQGALRLRGPAAFANLVLKQDSADAQGLSRTERNATPEGGVVRNWRFATKQTPVSPAGPNIAEVPTVAGDWRPVTAEEGGFVNLNRQFYASEVPAAISWLKTEVTVNKAMQKRVSLGWIGQAWIFVNGKLLTTGRNFYYPDAERRRPDGRLSLENGSFLVPLQPGRNEITVALFASLRKAPALRTRYGWGLMMRFDDTRGLSLQPVR